MTYYVLAKYDDESFEVPVRDDLLPQAAEAYVQDILPDGGEVVRAAGKVA
jgi:hypothetical protein